MYTVASRTRGVRVQKVLDPDIANLLGDDNLSPFGSDVEDLEEDFVVKANLPEGDEDEDDGKEDTRKSVFEGDEEDFDIEEVTILPKDTSAWTPGSELLRRKNKSQVGSAEKPRAGRLLDDQFELVS